MFQIIVIFLGMFALMLATREATGAPTTQPMTVQIDAVPTLLNDLESIDPSTRDRAREQLMMLDADQLPMLREMIEKLESLSIAQSIALKDIVIHIHATGEHNFVGKGEPMIGFRRTNSDDCVIASRRVGYDSYRVLRDGDQFVQVALVDPRDGSISKTAEIKQFTQIRNWITNNTVAGSWMEVTVIRSGERVNVRLRVAHDPDNGDGSEMIYKMWLNAASDYWTREFEPIVSERSKRR